MSINNQKSIFKTFIKYVSLNVLSMIGLSFYILADTYFISSGVGNMGVAALNIVLPVYCLISGIGLMLGMGAATHFSILIGEGKEKDASKCFTHAFCIGLLLGLVFFLVGTFFSSNIAMLLGADVVVMPLAETYLQTVMSFAPAFIINQIFVCFVRNDKQPRLTMIAMLSGSLSNVVLDYIFIFPLGMGMFGAAFATGLAPIISMLVLSRHYITKSNHFHFIKSKPSVTPLKHIFSLGLPSFITEFSSGIIMAIFNFIILGIAGSIGVAAYGIVANLALVVVSIFTGIAQGIQPVVSRNVGLKKFGDNKKILIYAITLAVILGAVFYFIGMFGAKTIANVFNKEQNIALTKMAIEGIQLYFIAFFIMGINIVVSAFFAASSKPFQSFVISITRGCVAIIPLSLLLSYLFQMTGVWLTIPSAEIVTLVISMIFLFKFMIKTSKTI